MKRAKPASTGGPELRRAYGAADLRGGVRGKYFKRYSAGANVVRIDADLAKSFPDDKSVNDALRLLVAAAKKAVRTRTA
jgi:hypothetical protein